MTYLKAQAALDQGYLERALRESADRIRPWAGTDLHDGLLLAHSERIAQAFTLKPRDVSAEIARLIKA